MKKLDARDEESSADLYDLGPQMDILVYTPEEFSRIMDKLPVGFWRSVKEQMVRLI